MQQAREGLGALAGGVFRSNRNEAKASNDFFEVFMNEPPLRANGQAMHRWSIGARLRTRWIRGRSSADDSKSGLQLSHLFGQHPQRAIEANAAIDAADRPRAQPAALDAASWLSATDHVLLNLCAQRTYV